MAKSQTKTSRTRTTPRATARAAVRKPDFLAEADSTYFFKLVCVALVATLWIKLSTPLSWQGIPIAAFPLGAIVGLAGIRLFEKNPYDRRIWYAVLIVLTIICYFVPAGIII